MDRKIREVGGKNKENYDGTTNEYYQLSYRSEPVKGLIYRHITLFVADHVKW